MVLEPDGGHDVRIALLLAVVLLSACQSAPPAQPGPKKAAPPPAAPVQAKVAGFDLILRDAGDRCVVEASREAAKTVLDLEFRGPCDFVRDHRGEVMSHRYADAGNVTVVIVVGEIVVGENKARCGPVTRGILLRDSGAKRSTRIGRGPQVCPASGLDEVEFSLYGHEK